MVSRIWSNSKSDTPIIQGREKLAWTNFLM
jgi:hypothetical protein